MTLQGATRERTRDNIREFWEKTAAEFKTDPAGTIRDRHFQHLEIDAVCSLLEGRDRVLDIGCGNGYATIHYASHVNHIVGMDYVESFVESAQTLLGQFPRDDVKVGDNIEFRVGDVTQIPADDASFDAVVGERVLINLPEPELQQKAVAEIARVLKPGGLYICVEVTEQGHSEVNRYREMFGLEILERYWHNRYLDESSFLQNIPSSLELAETRRFGMYQFLSKVIHPLVVAPDTPKFDSRFNEVARQIAEKMPEFEKCSHQIMFVFQKR